MTPGELIIDDGTIELNVGRETLTLDVANTGDRPIQVGSHYHFFETNDALHFDRAFPATPLSGEAKALFVVHESEVDGGRERRLSTRLIYTDPVSLATTVLPPDRTTSGIKPAGAETAAVRIARLEAENARLRAEKVKVETERDILRKAAKYFAGETNW